MHTVNESFRMDLEGFYAGYPDVLAAIYREHIDDIEKSVSRYFRGIDAENVVHDVFLSLLERPDLRRQFTGGNFRAWLNTMAIHRATDYARQKKRWQPIDHPTSFDGYLEPICPEDDLIHKDQIRSIKHALDVFSKDILPKLGSKVTEMFNLRFGQGVSQAEAARQLGISRTSAIEREQRFMKPLSQFLKEHLHERP